MSFANNDDIDGTHSDMDSVGLLETHGFDQ